MQINIITIKNRQRSNATRYVADSIKVALGISNCTLEIHSLVGTRENHCIVLYAQIPNAQLPEQPWINYIYWFNEGYFGILESCVPRIFVWWSPKFIIAVGSVCSNAQYPIANDQQLPRQPLLN